MKRLRNGPEDNVAHYAVLLGVDIATRTTLRLRPPYPGQPGIMSTVTPEEPLVCAHCGQVVEGRELDFRFKLPDSLFEIPKEERGQRVHDGGDMVGAPSVGVFVRVLLPVTLTEGYLGRYGTWLQLTSEADFDRACELWHAPEYPSMVLDGILGNAISMMPPWRPLWMALPSWFSSRCAA